MSRRTAECMIRHDGATGEGHGDDYCQRHLLSWSEHRRHHGGGPEQVQSTMVRFGLLLAVVLCLVANSDRGLDSVGATESGGTTEQGSMFGFQAVAGLVLPSP